MDFPFRYNAAVDLVDSHVHEGRGDKVAVRTPDASWTYAELAAAVNRAGNVLRDLGLEIESRVFICLPDGIDALVTFFGAIKIGAVPTLHAPGMPASYHGRLRLVRAEESLEDHCGLPAGDWEGLAARVDVVMAPGDHYSIFDRDRVAHIGAILRAAIEDAGADLGA